MSLRGLVVAPIGIAIAIAAGSATETLAFLTAQVHRGFNNYHDSTLCESALSSTSALAALIYGIDGSVVGDDVFDNPDDGVTRIADEDGENSIIILKSLKSTIDNPSVWNKIACAFAPPPHDRLTPEVVRDASPVGFSDNSIDIALAVPASTEGGASNAAANQLVRVLVTVRFPQAWAFEKDACDDKKISALLGQVKVLEGLAEDRLSEQRSSGVQKDDPGYYETQVIEQRWRKRLEEEPEDDLPEWWASIAPPFASLEVREEAALLKKLLNEDEFEDELRALFIEHCKNNSPLVFRASVASVGASGLFLKARVATTIEEAKLESDDGKEADILSTISIPYCNPPKDVTTAEELREGVLLLVESVVPMPIPIIPREKEVSTESAKESITPFNEQVVEMVAELENEAENLIISAADEDSKKPLQMSEDASESESDEDSSTKATDVDADSSSDVETEPEGEDGDEVIITEDSSKSDAELSRQQSRPPEEEARLAAKYAAIEDLGERAFTILVDLGMVQVTGSK